MSDSKDGIKDDGDETKFINLKVMSQDKTEVHFKIKRTTPMLKLKKAYCKRQGIQIDHVRFLFDGDALADGETPDSLEMEDNDLIDVVVKQTGGC
eukprot:gene8130-10044_t